MQVNGCYTKFVFSESDLITFIEKFIFYLYNLYKKNINKQRE